MARRELSRVVPAALVPAALCLSLASVTLLAAPCAFAQNPEAARQFAEGKRLRDAGDCRGAIAAFKASLEHEASIGGYYNLGFCNDQIGQRQEAYANYRRASALAEGKKDERMADIAGAIASLELKSEYVRLLLPTKTFPKGTVIRVDDETVPEAYYDVDLVFFTKKAGPPHDVVVRAPGYEERRLRVESKAPVPVDLRASTKATPEPVKSPPTVAAEPGGMRWQHWTAIGLGVAGLAAGGAAVFVGLDHKGRTDDIRDTFANEAAACRGRSDQTACRATAEQKQANDMDDENGRVVAPLAITIGASVVFLGAAAVLWITAPSVRGKPARASLDVVPLVSDRTQGLALVGRF